MSIVTSAADLNEAPADTTKPKPILLEAIRTIIREIGEELDLRSPFEIYPATNKVVLEAPAAGGD